jgi:putative nucleotidyltransferase with HDIG domain
MYLPRVRRASPPFHAATVTKAQLQSWQMPSAGLLGRLGDAGLPAYTPPPDGDEAKYRPASSNPPARIRILVVDDDDLVRDTFAAILSEEGYDICCANGAQEALACLCEKTFDIMLCDIFMPGMNGLELLPAVTGDYPDMPVILITGYGSVEMAREALTNGAADFITKPCGPGELPIIVERNLTRQAVARRNAQWHRHDLAVSNETVLDALLTALNTRDTETEGHSERVTAYTIELADRMGLPETELYHIERGALLHDIGKIGVPDSILLKPGKLTPEEWVEMRKHPVIGYEMCSNIDILKIAAEVVLHHHEAWDGGGYPQHLKGTDIPLGSRIFALADTLDAMTSNRPYRAALPFEAAREEIQKFSGKQFDPALVEIFLSVPEARWQYVRAQTEIQGKK